LRFQSSIIYLFSANEGSGEASSVNVVLKKTTQKNYTKILKKNLFTLPKLNLERKSFKFLYKMQVDVSKSCQETDLVDLEVPTDEKFIAAS
jgi:hypothetical protein